jgi:hypothetical protein
VPGIQAIIAMAPSAEAIAEARLQPIASGNVST